MMDQESCTSTELMERIEAVARECRSARRMLCLRNAALIAFLLTLAATMAYAFLPENSGLTAAVFLAYLLGMLAACWQLVLKPLRKPITMEQVALFIDEHYPELENRITTALQIDREAAHASRWVVEKFLDDTLPIVRRTPFTPLLHRPAATKQGLLTLLLLVSTLTLILVYRPLWELDFTSVKRIATGGIVEIPFSVEPGDARIPKGESLMVWIRGHEQNEKVIVQWRFPDGEWHAMEAQTSASQGVSYHEFQHVQRPIMYRIEVGRLRTKTFEIMPWVPQEVTAIDLTYHYPDYLNRPPREVPNSGNITAIEGSEVEVAVWVNRGITRADMVFDDGARVALTEQNEALWGTRISITKNKSYHIELFDEDIPSEFNTEYTILAKRDRPPEVRIQFPRGDSAVTLLEEVPFVFDVTDDYGFSDFGIQYEIAGHDPVRIPLGSHQQSRVEVEGNYLLMLEDLSLEVGDFITWSVWATDAKPDREAYELLGDPFFLEIRPFSRRYMEALSEGGQGGGGGDAEDIQKQKEIIIATWNLRRDSGYLGRDEFLERRTVIIENQSELLETIGMATAMGAPQPKEMLLLQQTMRRIIDTLAMAEMPEPATHLSTAASSEQQAYRLMLKLQPDNVQVTRQGGGGGGSGNGSETRPEIDTLEMTRNRNFYEEENLTNQEDAAAQEVIDSLKELAQRQQIVNDEIAQLVSELQQAETKEAQEALRRKLERLEEELRENLKQLDEVRQQLAKGQMSNERTREAQQGLRDARQQMNRSLEQLENDQLQEARASGARAMDSLNDIQEQLEQFSRGAAARRMRQLQEEMRELRERQLAIAKEAQSLREDAASPSLDNQETIEDTQKRLAVEKEELAGDFLAMMNQAGELAERARDTQGLMARGLGDWLRRTSRDGIIEDIEEGQPLLKYGIWDSLAPKESRIVRKMDKAAEALDEVAELLVADKVDGMQKALEQVDLLLARAEELSGELAASDESGEASSPSAEGETGPSPHLEGLEPGDEGMMAGSSTSEDTMREFIRDGYNGWLEQLRSAEDLLPQDSPSREQLGRIRETIEGMRREWRSRALAPKYDLFLESAAQPLEAAARELQREIQVELRQNEFLLIKEGEIPQQYKGLVADYFKQLSESGGAS